MPQRRYVFPLFSLLILLLVAPCALSQAGTEAGHYGMPIRVGLLRSFKSAKQINVSGSSAFSISRTGGSDKLGSYAAASTVTIKLEDDHLTITASAGDPVTAGTSVTVTPSDPSATTTLDSPGLQARRYRGSIEVSIQQSGLLVVNVLDVEDYLPGVLVGEMPSSFPEEALKSQAVAARCYTLCSRSKHQSEGFSVCDSSHCQNFDGCLRETPKVTSAVVATKGQILTYKGKIASVMYHADCGGATEDYCNVYEKGDYPYLCAVNEPEGVPVFAWEKSYKPDELAAKLVAAGIEEADGLQKVTVTKTSASGRALEVGITGARVSTTISGSKLRVILGASTLKSTLFTVNTAEDGTITFKGKGRGHGIGMSQVGAKALAAAPFNYTYAQILAHYFPGTTLTAARGNAATPGPDGASKNMEDDAHLGAAESGVSGKTGSAMLDVRVLEPKL